ncbi:MAG: CPBP family intramembrane metalloprotease [Bacilli bacterium]|nr:CPBP family intramembrane metalloprotease [Bacilli bacterium]
MLLEQHKNRWNYLFKGLGILFIYFIVSLFKNIPFVLLHISTDDISDFIKMTYNIILELLIIFTIYTIYNKEIKAAIKDLKENHLTYFKKYFSAYLLGVIVMMLANVLINRYGGGLSENETVIRNEFAIHPIYTFISAVFLAPILEESVFRMGIKSLVENKFIYILLSGLVFGSLHLMNMELNYLFPLYLLSYCSEGFAFAYMVSKTNNFLVPMGFHFMHNGIILSIQTFLLIFT